LYYELSADSHFGVSCYGTEAYIIKAYESTTAIKEVKELIKKEGDFLRSYPEG